MGIYVGNFPNRFCPEGPPIVLTDTVTKTGTRFSWSSWIKVLNGDSTIISDALVDGFFDEVRAQTGNGGLDNIRIHLFVHGTDRDISRMFIRAAETLEFAPMD
ncbi:MAG: hypothetical protein JXA18_11900 [Chitinispirillaceae bacterium]|nr:hypothetical protein [Chitinispirillaceae bacterium]